MTREQVAATAPSTDAEGATVERQPIGTARVTIAAAAAFLTLLSVVLAFIAGVNNGLMVLATVFLVVFVFAVGAHRRAYWAALWEERS